MYLTDAQLSQLRARPHRTRLWLSIFRPRVVLEASIRTKVRKSDTLIGINILSGSMLDEVGGMTVYIRTSQGSQDVGRIRLRSGSGLTLTLAENALDWEQGWFLTVVRYFEPWGVYPRIILDDDDNPIFYKDWDVLYTDQNEEFDPVVCLGPNDAGMLNLDEIAPTGSHRVWYTSSGSYDPTPGGSLSTFGWHFEGGSPTGSTAAHPGYVTYTGVGNYVTSLEITTGDGKSFTGRRHVRVMARPENAGSEKPANAWGLESLFGDRDSGGYTGDIWMREPANPEDIVDGALVVIFSEDFEGGVDGKIGANAENRGNIFFVGYILSDSTNWNPETNVLNFSVGGTNARLAELATYDTAIDNVKASEVHGHDEPPWTRMPALTVDRALAHYLRWHSTVLAVQDFSPTLDTLALQGADIGRGNVYEVTNAFLDTALGAQLVSDRQGKLWAEVRANLRPTGSDRQPHGHMQSVIEITKQDWRNEIAIERRGDSELAYLEMSGVAWSGENTGTFDAYLSGAPGKAPDYFGSASRIGNLALLGQDQLNQLTGNAWASSASLYPTVTVPLAGDYRFLDIAPQQRVEMTLAPADTWRQITWNQKTFMPDAISYEYRASDQILLMDMDTMEETFGGPGETIIIPVDAPYDHTVLPDWDIDFPPIVPPKPDDPPVLPPPGPGEIIYLLTTNRLSRCLDFTSGGATGSTWENITPLWATSGPGGPGTDGGVTGSMKQFRLDPLDPLNIAYLMTERGGGVLGASGPRIYKITNLNGITGTQSYQEVLSAEQYGDIAGITNQFGANEFTVSPLNTNIIYYQGRHENIGADQVFLKTLDGGLSWEDTEAGFPVGTNQVWTGFLKASDHSIDTVFALAEFGRELYWSNSFGVTWNKLRDAGTHGMIHIPFNANPGDNIIYAGWPGKLIITDDKFTTESDDIRPDFAGSRWDPGSGIPQNSPYDDTMQTWHLNRLFIAGIFRAGSINMLFYATDGVDAGFNSWLPGYPFPDLGGVNILLSFVWHETNSALMAAAIDGDDGDDGLYLSVDGGLSFINGLTRWEEGEGLGTTHTPDNLGWNVICMRWSWLA